MLTKPMLCGRILEFDQFFSRYLASGNLASVILTSFLRQIQHLQVLKEHIERYKKTPSTVIADAKPPIFFTRRRNIELALRIWTQTTLQDASNKIQNTILESRRTPRLTNELSRQTLYILAAGSAHNLRKTQ